MSKTFNEQEIRSLIQFNEKEYSKLYDELKEKYAVLEEMKKNLSLDEKTREMMTIVRNKIHQLNKKIMREKDKIGQ